MVSASVRSFLENALAVLLGKMGSFFGSASASHADDARRYPRADIRQLTFTSALGH
jgi:hypothetical protein